MFYKSEKVKTCNEVTAKEKEILVSNGIKPGTVGVVVSSVTQVTVNFDGKLVILNENSLELFETGEKNIFGDDGLVGDDGLNTLKNIFGFK